MDSVFFLIDTLGKQITSLNDINSRLDRIYKMVNDFLTTLHYCKSVAKQKTRTSISETISGGSLSCFDLEGILTFDQSLSQSENVLNVIYQVQTLWPFVKSKVDLLVTSIKGCLNQSNVCMKLANPLSEKLQNSITKNSIDKITLIAFNSDMAQLDARISIVIFICKSLNDDLKDLNTISSTVLNLATQEDLFPILKLMNDSAKSMLTLMDEINSLAKDSMGAPLINPKLLDVTKNDSHIEKIIDSSTRTLNTLNKI